MNLRLLTINTWKCDGLYSQRLVALRVQLQALKPDIVAVQESFHSADAHWCTARYLAEALHMDMALVRQRRKVRQVEGCSADSYSSLAMLSRFPLTDNHGLALPSSVDDGGRSAQLCCVEVAGVKMLIANVHLSHLSPLAGGAALRQQQLQALTQALLAHNAADLQLICGDFNAGLPELGLAALAGAPWQDAYRAAGGGSKVTHTSADGIESDLDHILFTGRQRFQWVAARVVLHQVDALSGVLPSDHAGVCVELCLDGPPEIGRAEATAT